MPRRRKLSALYLSMKAMLPVAHGSVNPAAQSYNVSRRQGDTRCFFVVCPDSQRQCLVLERYTNAGVLDFVGRPERAEPARAAPCRTRHSAATCRQVPTAASPHGTQPPDIPALPAVAPMAPRLL